MLTPMQPIQRWTTNMLATVANADATHTEMDNGTMLAMSDANADATHTEMDNGAC